MSDIDWGMVRPQPDLSSQFVQSYEAGRVLGRQRRADNALAALRANPNDQQAATDLSIYAPEDYRGIAMQQDRQRAGLAREAAGNVIASYGMPQGGQPNAMAQGGGLVATQQQNDQQAQLEAQYPNAPRASDYNGAPPATLDQFLTQPAQPQQPAMGQQPGMVGQPQPGQPQAGAVQGQQGQPSPLSDPTHPAAVAVGQAVSEGRADPTQAWAALYSVDPELGDKMMNAVKGMDSLRLSRLNEMQGAMAAAAQTLKNTPPEQRQALAMRMLPQLATHGVTPQMVQQADLSDQGLAGIIGQAVGIEGMIKNSQTDRQFGLDQQKAQDAHDEGILQTVTNADGTTSSRLINKRTGVEMGGNNSGTGGTVGTGGGASIGDRNNNPGNLKDGAFARSQPGYTGSNGGFAVFSDAGAGAKAQETLLGTNYLAKGVNTVSAIIDRYAPAGENSSASQANYKAYVAKKLNVSPNDTLSPAVLPRLAQAMREFETGHTSGGAGGSSSMTGSGGGNAGLTPQALEQAAINYNRTGQIPPSLGRSGAAQKAILAKAAEISQAAGNDPNTQADNWQNYKSRQKSLTSFNDPKGAGGTVRSLSVANDHLDMLQEAATALQNGNNQSLNSISQSIAAWTGQSAPTTFGAVKQVVAGEIVKAITASNGALGDRQELESAIQRSNSPQQLRQVIQHFKTAMAAQLQGFQREYETGTGNKDFGKFVSPSAAKELGLNTGQNAAPVRVNSPQDAARLPSGTLFQTPDGRVIRKH